MRRRHRLVDALRRWGQEPDAPYFAYFALAVEGSAASAAVLRNLLGSARHHALDWPWAFRNVATSGGDEMKMLAADVLVAGRASLNRRLCPSGFARSASSVRPEWQGALTKRFEIAWKPPRMHPYGLTESEQERVLAWLLRNRVSSIKPPGS